MKKKLLQNDSEKPNKVIFESDGCTYYNRNCIISYAFLWTVVNNNKIAEQTFLEKPIVV